MEAKDERRRLRVLREFLEEVMKKRVNAVKMRELAIRYAVDAQLSDREEAALPHEVLVTRRERTVVAGWLLEPCAAAPATDTGSTKTPKSSP